MKIIIIILICLFFSLTITPITESLINPPEPQTDRPPAETPIAGPAPSQAAPDGGLQTQINLLSTQIKTTNEVAIEAKNKVDEITSEIDKLKKSLAERPKD